MSGHLRWEIRSELGQGVKGRDALRNMKEVEWARLVH